jgi:hypothetical protein
MARLRLGLFGTPRDELAATVDGEVPEWIDRLDESYSTTAETAPASASVLALGESLVYRMRKVSLLLAKMEALGWSIRPRRSDLLDATGLDEGGNVRWSHGLLP